MKFGELFIGTNRGTGRNSVRKDGKWVYVQTFPILAYMMERPDNGLIIVEDGQALYQEHREHLFPVSEESRSKLEEILKTKYERLIASREEKYNQYNEDWLEADSKKKAFEEELTHLREINNISHTENREKAIRQSEKHSRRLSHRLVKFEKMMMDKQKEIQNFKEELAFSLEVLNEQMNDLLS